MPQFSRARIFPIAAMVLAIASTAVIARQQARDSAPAAPAGTASIAGTVLIDGPSKQPARRARVTLTDLARTSPGQTTTTDEDGAFAFGSLPAGRFEVQAFKPGYLRGSYGASRPERAGTPIVVKGGEAVANLTLTVARGGVITGTVRDPRGRPAANTTVRALKIGYNALTGERTLGAPGTGSTATTDDRGIYRAYGLPPGGYIVLVVPPPGYGRPGVPDDIRPLTSLDVQRALQAARSGAPGGVSVSMPAITAAATPARLNYAPVFHPGVADIGVASTVTLGLSEERSGVDVAVQLITTATITGRVTDPSGPLPPTLSIRLVPAGPSLEMLAGAGLRGQSTSPGPDGSYTITGVTPGPYRVVAELGRGRGVAAPSAPAKWASADINVDGRDLNVPLTLQPGVAINGRVVFEGARPAPADLQTLSFLLMPPGSGGQMLSNGGGRVDGEGRFVFAGITPNAYQFAANWTAPGAAERWTIKSSVSNGRDAFEAPLQVNANDTLEWTVTYTDKPTTLAGVFQDRSGRAATDYYLLVFSTTPDHWTPGSRRIRTIRPGTDGAFAIKGLPPGEYYLAALTDLESGEWNDPTLLERLVPTSIKVTLRDGQVTTQDLRIGGL